MCGIAGRATLSKSRWEKRSAPTPARSWRTSFFFFQAEDGIRDHCVTGVQTCAVPISRRIWQISHDAAGELIALLERLSTGTAVTRRDTVYYTTDGGDVAALHAEYVARRQAGFEATWLTARALRVEAGIPARAGIRTHGNAHCDPVRACA